MPKVSAITKPPNNASMAALADEFGRVERDLAELKPLTERRDQLRKQILDLYKTAPADQAFTLDGAAYSVGITQCSNERVITSMLKVLKRLGEKVFLSICKVSLSDLDAHIPTVEQGPFVTSTPNAGPRKVKSFLKLPPDSKHAKS